MPGRMLKLKEEERHILERLPLLLKKDAQFRREVSVVLSETLATKDELRQVLEEIRISREEANRRFEAMDRRFEAMDRRFETLVSEMHQGFELHSKAIRDLEIRTESLVQEMRKGFELQSKAIRDLEIRLETAMNKGLRDVNIKIDTVGARWGIFAESTIRNTLKELFLKNLKVTEVKEWKVQDKDGFVFGYPQEIQGDILIKDGEDYLVEIKSSAGSGDVTILHRKAKFYEQITGILPKMIFVAVNMKEEGKKSCQELSIQLITYEDIKD
ncbi:MAG: DUF3782 domain-containing protein [bacterium]